MSTPITIHWDESLEPNVDHYDLYYGTASGQYNLPGSPQNMGNNVEGTVFLDVTGTVYFALTVVLTTTVQSAFSTEISTVIAPSDEELAFCRMDSLNAMACY